MFGARRDGDSGEGGCSGEMENRVNPGRSAWLVAFADGSEGQGVGKSVRKYRTETLWLAFWTLRSTGSGLPAWPVAFTLPAAFCVAQTSFPHAASDSDPSTSPERNRSAPPATWSRRPPLHTRGSSLVCSAEQNPLLAALTVEQCR